MNPLLTKAADAGRAFTVHADACPVCSSGRATCSKGAGLMAALEDAMRAITWEQIKPPDYDA